MLKWLLTSICIRVKTFLLINAAPFKIYGIFYFNVCGNSPNIRILGVPQYFYRFVSEWKPLLSHNKRPAFYGWTLIYGIFYFKYCGNSPNIRILGVSQYFYRFVSEWKPLNVDFIINSDRITVKPRNLALGAL